MNRFRELLAQSILPRLDCSRYVGDADYRTFVLRLVEERSVGGFVVFDGDVRTVSTVLEQIRDAAVTELMFAADCEQGVTMRFPGGTEFPSMMALGSGGDVSVTYTVAECIAEETRALGIGWNFAPVADINTNPRNPIINIRAFGDRPETVSAHVRAYVRGMQDNGVVACAKHFPGHGDTSIDSHLELPVLDADLDRLRRVELAPFAAAIEEGVRSIMVSHVAVPSIDPSGAPASLSGSLTHGLIREELGYEGVIVTDALDMHAITRLHSPGDAAVRAYLAGCDILETMPDPVAALDALCRGADDGTIHSGRIARTAERIADLNAWAASHDVRTRRTPEARSFIALEAARRTIRVQGTLTRIEPPLFILALSDELENPRPEEWFTYLSTWYGADADGAFVTGQIAPSDLAEISRAIDEAGTVLLGLFVRPRGFAGTVGLAPAQEQLVRRAGGKELIVMNFGNPYLLTELVPGLRIDTFSPSSASLAASVEALSARVATVES